MSNIGISATIWTCPTVNDGVPCGNYYGANGEGDLSQKMNQKYISGQGRMDTHTRASCPACGAWRKPVQVVIPIPT